jgi:methylated-DNA-[protein]-cysteine S-methyltransferase
MSTFFTQIDAPIGPLLIAASEAGLREIRFHVSRPEAGCGSGWIEGPHVLLDAARRQLREYFQGRRTTFELPVAPEGTPFQRHVWGMLATIPYGQTISYAELASRVGRPGASRAVGAANGRNPLPIVLPCHRVIGADGSLTGFGGGLPLKRFLLELEGALPRHDLFATG